jgi:hypothetical protein
MDLFAAQAVSAAPLPPPAEDPGQYILQSPLSTVEASTQKFHNDGFIHLDNIFDPAEVHHLHDLAMNHYVEVIERITANDLKLGIGVKEGYKDIVQRHPNRFEMPYKMDSEEFAIICQNPHVMNLVKSILGDDAAVINKSLLVSMPGAEVNCSCCRN